MAGIVEKQRSFDAILLTAWAATVIGCDGRNEGEVEKFVYHVLGWPICAEGLVAATIIGASLIALAFLIRANRKGSKWPSPPYQRTFRTLPGTGVRLFYSRRAVQF